ncbi:MAG: DUF2027 domain-containing protein [Bacteroidales bacterium]
MKVKVGDRVRFLNEEGGGVVTAIKDPKTALVRIEDGFEIPVLIRELLPEPSYVDEIEEQQGGRPQRFEAPPPPQETYMRPLTGKRGSAHLDKGIYLAFVPEDQQILVAGNVDVWLVNHTSWDVLYSLFLKNRKGEVRGEDYGNVDPFSRGLLGHVNREELEDWISGVVQLLFHSNHPENLPAPAHCPFRVKIARFFKETGYTESQLIAEKALYVSLLPATLIIRQTDRPAGREKAKEEQVTVSGGEHVVPEHLIHKHQTGPREAVIDLHIESLVDNPYELDPSAMLKIQTDYFIRCLDSAIVNGFRKLTFIHGVGTGTLKQKIVELAHDYEQANVREAPMNKFGYGAIEILLPGN